MSSGLFKQAKNTDGYFFAPSLHHPPAGTSLGPSCHSISLRVPAAPALQTVGLGEATSQPGQAFWKRLPPAGVTHQPLSVPRSNSSSFRIPAKPTSFKARLLQAFHCLIPGEIDPGDPADGSAERAR